MQMCVVVYASSGQLKRWCGALLLGTFIAAFAASALGYISPYSVDDPSYPMPKRFFMQVRKSIYLLKCEPAETETSIDNKFNSNLSKKHPSAVDHYFKYSSYNNSTLVSLSLSLSLDVAY